MPLVQEPAFESDDPAALAELFGPTATLKKLAGGFRAADGPVWSDAEGGYLVFADLLNNKRFRYSRKSGITPIRGDAKQAASHAFDAQGRLITCELGARRLSRAEKDASVTPLVERYAGKKLNGPAAVAVKSDGTLWFTDPGSWIKKEPIEQPGRYVYRLDLKGHHLSAVATDIEWPGGLCFSPDEATLYVSDAGHPQQVFAYGVVDGKSLANRRAVFSPGAPPRGLGCDAAGHLYVAADDALHILEPDGSRIARCPLPPAPSSNPLEGGKLLHDGPTACCLGDAGGRTLYLTSRASLYAIPLNV